jgi:hypothetical protein
MIFLNLERIVYRLLFVVYCLLFVEAAYPAYPASLPQKKPTPIKEQAFYMFVCCLLFIVCC